MGTVRAGVSGAVAVLSLAACGGGGTEAAGGIFTPGSNYAALTDATGGTSSLSGGLVNTTTLSTGTIDGTYTHSDQSIFVSNPSTAGFASVATVDPLPFNTYDYAQSVDVTTGGVTYTGIVGLETSNADMAGSTDVTYTVEFEGTYVTNGGSETLTDWSGTLAANFSTNDLDLDVTGTGVTAFDRITISDATIIESGFSGGALSTRLGATTVDVTGTTSNTSGAFFGYDTTLSAPDEVGGVIASQSGSNILTGAFIGD